MTVDKKSLVEMTSNEEEMDDLESEFQLGPVVRRPEMDSTLSPDRVVNHQVVPEQRDPQHQTTIQLEASTFLADSSISDAQRTERARARYNESAGMYPAMREYPTLDAMQRLSRLFGYAAVAIVFPYLLLRLLRVIWLTDEGLLKELVAFSEFAVPVIFGTAGLIGFLFTASEGIKLAMDIQENTLRIANRSGRRKE
ncbi:MAG: hypothetical protein WBD20_15315 [Pirellulaceae bacterium]